MTRSIAVLCSLCMALLAANVLAAPKPPTTGDILGTIVVCGEAEPGVVYLDGHSYYAKTSTGSFVLHNVPVGSYTLIVEVPGVMPKTYSVTLAAKELTVDTRYCPDVDEDGYDASVDCNDNNPAIHPGAVEACDDVDNNCDGQVDEGCPTCTVGALCGNVPHNVGQCRQGTYNANCECIGMVGPSEEVCDGIDNNCDGQVDEGLPTPCP